MLVTYHLPYRCTQQFVREIYADSDDQQAVSWQPIHMPLLANHTLCRLAEGLSGAGTNRYQFNLFVSRRRVSV